MGEKKEKQVWTGSEEETRQMERSTEGTTVKKKSTKLPVGSSTKGLVNSLDPREPLLCVSVSRSVCE